MTPEPDARELAARAAEAAATHPLRPAAHEEDATDHYPVDTLSDAAEGLPDAESARTVLAHAETCPVCAAHVADLARVTEGLHLLQSQQMPPEVISRLQEALASEAATRTAAEETTGAAAHRRLVERTTRGTFGANAPRHIDPRGIGLNDDVVGAD